MPHDMISSLPQSGQSTGSKTIRRFRKNNLSLFSLISKRLEHYCALLMTQRNYLSVAKLTSRHLFIKD